MGINLGKTEGAIIRLGKLINTPEQRLIVGVTALALQPALDLNNKDVDEDTRILAASKSFGKIIAGTTSGVLVRLAFIKLGEYLTKPGKLLDPLKDLSTSKIKEYAKHFPNAFKSANQKLLIKDSVVKQYSKTVGNYMAVAALLVTNFLWDAPVTKKLTNYFYKKLSGKEAK